jgi:apolipoprotein N-acyltransferase
VIQIADVLGEYGVTFLIVLVAAAIAEALPLVWFDASLASDGEPGRPRPRRPRIVKLLPAAVAIVAAVGYGYFRLADLAIQASIHHPPKSPRVALIQSDMLATLKGASEADDQAIMDQQMDLSRQAVRESDRPVDVVIWPETMYRDPLWTIDPKVGPSRDQVNVETLAATERNLAARAKELNAALLVGIDRLNLVRSDAPGVPISDSVPYRLQPFNSSACVDRKGRLLGTYDKMHLLPFGEYVPFVEWFPFLQKYSPITGFAASGRAAAAFELDGVTYAPNICYETVLPQVIRAQVVELIARSQWPDVLVNLTNDAWYEGSAELEMHLASGVFRAIEMRTPLVIAANRGLTAYVDYRGQVIAVTQRNRPAKLVVDVEIPPRHGVYPTLYAAYGDWFSLTCLLCCVAMVAIEWRYNKREKSQ